MSLVKHINQCIQTAPIDRFSQDLSNLYRVMMKNDIKIFVDDHLFIWLYIDNKPVWADSSIDIYSISNGENLVCNYMKVCEVQGQLNEFSDALSNNSFRIQVKYNAMKKSYGLALSGLIMRSDNDDEHWSKPHFFIYTFPYGTKGGFVPTYTFNTLLHKYIQHFKNISLDDAPDIFKLYE